MYDSYSVLIDMRALDSLPRSGKTRDKVLDFARSLGFNGQAKGDFQMRDQRTYRFFEVSSASGYGVVWWFDAPANAYIVVSIEKPI